MTKKIQKILKEVLKKIEPSKKDLEFIEKQVKKTKLILEKNIKKQKIEAEVFEGGSFAKGTVIKKDVYDSDLFVRFDKKHKKENISKLAKKILKGIQKVSTIHGSRDYFRIKFSNDFFIEIVPVIKVKDPKKSDNITDLSYSHVKYINKKINKKIREEIKLAKAFCYASRTYGAESYISGFSGYALELLVYHYGSFLKFIKDISKYKKGKIIIDIEKMYKKKNDVLFDMNSSKLESPIILVDPTFKQRNVLAALSEETFNEFKKKCKEFLKNPSIEKFKIKKIDLKKVKKDALKKKNEFILLEIKTEKQEGDIAGSKLLKFYKHLSKEIEKYFEIKKKGFNYNRRKAARAFFVVNKKKEIIFEGPFEKDLKNVKAFKKQHKNTFVKKGKVCAKEKFDLKIEDFVKGWKNKNKNKLKEMSITGLKII